MLDTFITPLLSGLAGKNNGRKLTQPASHISGYLRHLKVSNFHFLSLLPLCERIKPAQTLWCFLLDWRCESETVSRQMRQRSDAIKTFSAFMGLILFPLWSPEHTGWHRKWNETPEESKAVLYWISSTWPITVLWNSFNRFQETQQMIGESTLCIHSFNRTVWLHFHYNRVY